ncbi:hypothetical protein BOTBODRAFT_107984 [Botryobasidium botryosum FD-172 SS1]|uniref:T6SS Phospholipase effector Tle1-like catalytic domain-containing protein n=1 Tax=Botryobasidium botryosum (strain FD-172 SS1) TaxID=930990 RepID=A0A067MVL3_BOTB1|nr:hypothetical protein BOTBODRAFT_107984 [Botryobasidium botryosum FD-172 SS1]
MTGSLPSTSNEQTPATSNDTQAAFTARNLVLCFDGTNSSFGPTNTNVVRLIEVLARDDDSKQMLYYQTGIGTYANPGIIVPFMLSLAKLADMMVAWYLDEHVMGGYRYLMQHYRPGDRIYLFGFSRGAYIARALAGMLHKVGLLPPSMFEQVPFAYKMYADNRKDREGLAQHFKKTLSRRNVRVHFVGAWDTVSSVGLIYSRNLPFTTSNESIRYFRHALALDERRVRFRPSLYQNPLRTVHRAEEKSAESTAATRPDAEQDQLKPVKEVWFAGTHADVGGGNVNNYTFTNRLANPPLEWMIGEACEAGLLLVENAAYKNVLGTSEDDVLAQAHDELKLQRAWWFLEYFPLTSEVWDKSAQKWRIKRWRWVLGFTVIVSLRPLWLDLAYSQFNFFFSFCRFNRGRARHTGPNPLVHESVNKRKSNTDPTKGEVEYTPRALLPDGYAVEPTTHLALAMAKQRSAETKRAGGQGRGYQSELGSG